MIGIDTNILVRYFIQDDADQAAIAGRVLNTQCSRDRPGWINRVVLCELIWVLESAYNCPRSEIAAILRALLQTAELKIEDHANAWQALNAYQHKNADFADALIFATNQHNGCDHTTTLDRKASRLHGGKLAG
jgi:predicted nucleic-acid-binding protein